MKLFKKNNKIIFETAVNMPNKKIWVIYLLGWIIFYIIIYFLVTILKRYLNKLFIYVYYLYLYIIYINSSMFNVLFFVYTDF